MPFIGLGLSAAGHYTVYHSTGLAACTCEVVTRPDAGLRIAVSVPHWLLRSSLLACLQGC